MASGTRSRTLRGKTLPGSGMVLRDFKSEVWEDLWGDIEAEDRPTAPPPPVPLRSTTNRRNAAEVPLVPPEVTLPGSGMVLRDFKSAVWEDLWGDIEAEDHPTAPPPPVPLVPPRTSTNRSKAAEVPPKVVVPCIMPFPQCSQMSGCRCKGCLRWDGLRRIVRGCRCNTCKVQFARKADTFGEKLAKHFRLKCTGEMTFIDDF